MALATCSVLSTTPNEIMKLKLQCNTEPALWHMHFVMHSAAVDRHLTTRMAKLWQWVGLRGFGIGVVFRGRSLFSGLKNTSSTR
jgi:hypothetical protein